MTPDVSPWLSEMIVRGLFQVVSQKLSNDGMSTVTETRRNNLMLLIQRFGTAQALADKLGKAHTQISQLRNASAHSNTGRARVIGDDLAREIEQKLGMPRGWMDIPAGLHTEPAKSPGEFSARSASIASRLDALAGDRQARAFALIDLTLRTLEAEASMQSSTAKPRSRKA